MQIFLDPQPAQQVGSVAFGVPAVHLGEFLLQFADFDSVLFREIGFRI